MLHTDTAAWQWGNKGFFDFIPTSTFDCNVDYLGRFTNQKKVGADGTVKYVDEQGKSIASEVTLSGFVGEPYITTKETIAGYTFLKVIGNARGSFTDTAQLITYVYKANSLPQLKLKRFIASITLIQGNTSIQVLLMSTIW